MLQPCRWCANLITCDVGLFFHIEFDHATGLAHGHSFELRQRQCVPLVRWLMNEVAIANCEPGQKANTDKHDEMFLVHSSLASCSGPWS